MSGGHCSHLSEQIRFGHALVLPLSHNWAIMRYTPPTLIVAIGKFHLADNKTTRPHLTRLIELLRELSKRILVKVLFTTAGGCVVLAETTKMAERVDARRMVQVNLGQPRRGWSSLDNLRVPHQGL